MEKHHHRDFKTEKQFASWNEAMFVKYNNERMYYHPNPILRWIERKRVKQIVKFAGAEDKTKVLEIGCGEGYILNQFPRGELYGIDLSHTAIARAKDRTKDNPNIKSLSVQNGERTSYKDGTFDVVLCSEVIEHVPHPEKIVAEMIRVAKPDGSIIITFPNEPLINFCKSIVAKLGLYKLILKGVPEHMDEEWHIHSFSKNMFLGIADGKLNVKQIKRIPLPFLPLRYATLSRRM